MKTYKHLTIHERDQLAVLYHQGKSIRAIAARLGRSPSTLLRELRRNPKGSYYPHKAHERALARHRHAHKHPRLKSRALQLTVEELIMKGWSPEIISGRLKRHHGNPTISHEAIYQWIYIQAPHLAHYLTRSHPQRRSWSYRSHLRSIRIPCRVSIRQRPIHIETRSEPGHWEADLIVSSGHTALQVVVERKSRFTRMQHLSDKSAHSSFRALRRILEPLPASLRRSITYDNGKENVRHQILNVLLRMNSYFCDPYHSWEKGTVENTNGLIRRFLPKHKSFDTIAPQDIQKVEQWLNNRPRKCLDFQTPAEVFKAGCCT